MTERSRNIAVGITALGALVGLGALLLLFGFVPGLLQDTYTIRFLLQDAKGLSEGSPVTLNGIRVGEVQNVELQDPPTAGVVAIAQLQAEYRLPASTTVSVYSPPLAGTASVSLHVPQNDQPVDQYLPVDGSATIKARPGGDGGMLGGLVEQISSRLEAPLQQFELVSQDLRELSQTWKAVGQNIRELTSPRTAGEVDDGGQPATAASVVARLDSRLAEMRQVLAGLDSYVNNPDLRQDVMAAAENARELTATATQAVQDARQQFEQLQRRYVAVADDMSAAIAEARQTLTAVREGRGTAGRLVNDPALYNNLNDASQRLNKAIEQFQLLIQKWREEGFEVGI